MIPISTLSNRFNYLFRQCSRTNFTRFLIDQNEQHPVGWIDDWVLFIKLFVLHFYLGTNLNISCMNT